MTRARLIPAVMVGTALLMIGGSVRAQPAYENPELSDVQTAFFWNSPNSAYSAVIATMSGGDGLLFPRFHGYRFGWTRDGNSGLIVFDLYEPDDIKRKGAGNWQVKQSDFVQFAFRLYSPLGSTILGSGNPVFSPIDLLTTYFGAYPVTYTMAWTGSPSPPVAGCQASINTKDKNRDGLPESASWKASCNVKNFTWLSADDQKLFKKVLKGLKGKGEFPAFYDVYYP